MFRHAVVALACVLSAVGLPAAAEATIFGFSFTIDFRNGDGAIGHGNLYATDNGDDTFTITGVDGQASNITFRDQSTYADDTLVDVGAGFFPMPGAVPTITFAAGEYSFDSLALYGTSRFYGFQRDSGGDLIGGSIEVGGPAQFNFLTVQASPAPEAATWAMMIVGFGAVGGALRRRRTVVTFA
jgi:hypothetical protein